MGPKAPKGETRHTYSESSDLEASSEGEALALPQRPPKAYQEPEDKAKAPQSQNRWPRRIEVWVVPTPPQTEPEPRPHNHLERLEVWRH
ncbi:hypothetical protein AMTR_s00054p00105760 [Amborella trichopoda]|uniref:Uncharacterized protein n=1 Tax=Amborella trichopoda TaxID=13333 RepID=U5D9P9_AMBTC|nr:hypothetical protein AMTR_s00054p00105760 [Amborella trichopoda]